MHLQSFCRVERETQRSARLQRVQTGLSGSCRFELEWGILEFLGNVCADNRVDGHWMGVRFWASSGGGDFSEG